MGFGETLTWGGGFLANRRRPLSLRSGTVDIEGPKSSDTQSEFLIVAAHNIAVIEILLLHRQDRRLLHNLGHVLLIEGPVMDVAEASIGHNFIF